MRREKEKSIEAKKFALDAKVFCGHVHSTDLIGHTRRTNESIVLKFWFQPLSSKNYHGWNGHRRSLGKQKARPPPNRNAIVFLVSVSLVSSRTTVHAFNSN